MRERQSVSAPNSSEDAWVRTQYFYIYVLGVRSRHVVGHAVSRRCTPSSLGTSLAGCLSQLFFDSTTAPSLVFELRLWSWSTYYLAICLRYVMFMHRVRFLSAADTLSQSITLIIVESV
jgi:hypothetical protein